MRYWVDAVLTIAAGVATALAAVALARWLAGASREAYANDRDGKKIRWFTRRQKKECGPKPSGGCDGLYKCEKTAGSGSNRLSWRCVTHRDFCERKGRVWDSGKNACFDRGECRKQRSHEGVEECLEFY